MRLAELKYEEIFNLKENQKYLTRFLQNDFSCVCPICKDKSDSLRVMMNKGVSYCSSCESFSVFNTDIKNTCTDERLSEIFKIYFKNKNNTLLRQQLNHIQSCYELEMGFSPARNWVKENDDWKWGRLALPLYDFTGDLVNICGCAIGKEERLKNVEQFVIATDKAGVYNIFGFWSEDLIICLNPYDCLTAISHGYHNAVYCSSPQAIENEILCQESVVILGYPHQEQECNSLSRLFLTKEKKRQATIYYPSDFEVNYFYELFKNDNEFKIPRVMKRQKHEEVIDFQAYRSKIESSLKKEEPIEEEIETVFDGIPSVLTQKSGLEFLVETIFENDNLEDKIDWVLSWEILSPIVFRVKSPYIPFLGETVTVVEEVDDPKEQSSLYLSRRVFQEFLDYLRYSPTKAQQLINKQKVNM